MEKEIEIPARLVEPLLPYAAETGLSVEEIVETAFRNYMRGDRRLPSGGGA